MEHAATFGLLSGLFRGVQNKKQKASTENISKAVTMSYERTISYRKHGQHSNRGGARWKALHCDPSHASTGLTAKRECNELAHNGPANTANVATIAVGT